jgi:FAD/FMN-containing dehydrogenase
VLTESADRAAYEADWRKLYANPALAVALPHTPAQVSALVRLCAAHGIAIVPQGGNTGLVAGGVPVAGTPQLILSLARMNRILALDPQGDTITVQAGVTLQAVQEAAAAADKLFPVSFGAEGTAQIGGVISTNAGGVQVLSYGTLRAQVLGLEVVLADGRIWDGLRALRKDNTGLDLKQIFIGAEGTLGVITAACLKLSPSLNARATALIGVCGPEAALTLFQSLRAQSGSGLTLCEYISGPAMALANAPPPFAAPAYVLAELSAHDATADVTTALESALAAALDSGTATHAVLAQSHRERTALIALRESVPEGELATGGAIKHDIAVPLAAIPATLAAIEALFAEKYPTTRLNIFGHIGDGNLHVNVRPPAGKTLAALAAQKSAITQAIESLAVARGGSFSAEHGIGQIRLPGMSAHKSTVELDLMRAIKTALDPQNLLNPGKMIPPKES